MMSVGIHARIAGRPGRTAPLDAFLARALTRPGVWVATRLQIAAAWEAAHPPWERGHLARERGRPALDEGWKPSFPEALRNHPAGNEGILPSTRAGRPRSQGD